MTDQTSGSPREALHGRQSVQEASGGELAGRDRDSGAQAASHGSLRQQIAAAVEAEIYEYRERTMLWEETGGITQEIARLATRGAMTIRDREMERMKLLAAASESPSRAVSMAADYADKAIANGERAERAEATIARVAALAEEYPVDIDTALIHAALDEAAPAYNAGPSIREAADADRLWPLQKHGE